MTKLAAQFGLLDDMKSKWETSLRPGIDLAATLLNIHSARLSLQPETMILSEPLALRAARLWNSVSDVRRPLVLAGTIFLQVLALAMSMFMALQYFLTGDPFPIVLMHSPILWPLTVLCVDQSCQSPISELLSKSLSARQILLYGQLPQFRKSRRIRPQLPDLVLDGLLLDRGEESGETILEAWEFGKCCRGPYVDVAVVRLNQTPIPPRPS